MVLLVNEVGGNLDMTGDVQIGGEKFICEKGCITQRKATRKAKKSQLLDLQTYLVSRFVAL